MSHPNANLDRIKLFADALVGDEFTQGHDYLAYQRVDETLRHCCLGVACEVAIANGLEISRQVLDIPDKFGRRHAVFGNEKFMLPGPVMDWYGFSGDLALTLLHPITGGRLVQNTAVRLNDELKVSFLGIARALGTTFDFRLDLSEVPDGE